MNILFIILFIIYLYIIFGFDITTIKNNKCNYPNWMTKLDKNTLIKDIVFPGTHDSLAYSWTNIDKIYSKNNSLFTNINKLWWIPGINYKINRWAKTQNLSIFKQLQKGVRCFDIRIVLEKDNKCYGFHKFLFSELNKALIDILKFIKRNPYEIIIIRYRSYSKYCDKILLDKLEEYILPYNKNNNVKNMKLSDFYNLNYNIILTSDIKLSNKMNKYNYPNLVYHDWKNTFSSEEKEEYIKKSLDNFNDENKMFNLDWTITPQIKQILINNSTLIKSAGRFNNKLYNFLQNCNKSIKKINIISVDAVDSIDLVKIIKSNNLS